MWRQSCSVNLGDKGMRREDGGRVERETMIMEVEDGGGFESETRTVDNASILKSYKGYI